MIPKKMKSFLRQCLPERTWRNRLSCEDDQCYMEFGPVDIDRLSRLGIEVDNLGPMLVACMWDEASSLEIGGYVVVDNLAMGQPSMGGIRMLPDITPSGVHSLARGMTLKNAAANLPYGGGKAGIVASHTLSPEEHQEVVRGFARLIRKYAAVYLPGPDVGTNDADMKTIAIENGLDNVVSKPADMGGNRIDELGAAAGGVIIALDVLLKEMNRLKSLPQFSQLIIPNASDLTVLVQGFGAVGAHAARILLERLPGARVVGVSDHLGYLFNVAGLPIDELFAIWQNRGLVTRPFYRNILMANNHESHPIKYATDPDDLLRESAFCFIPAAPIANYLDTDGESNPTMTVDRMGNWSVIIEGANTYSPDPARKYARARMERAVYRQKGTMIATDYLVNSGGVIFAAQEHLIKTPDALRIPDSLLGDPEGVEEWLQDHQFELARLADERRLAGEKYREHVIQKNMVEMVDLLISDTDMLPCEAAERISVRRIAAMERDRTAIEIMEPITTINAECSVQEAASMLIDARSSILAVLSEDGRLGGVVTEWDITKATATGCPDDRPLDEIMTKNVVFAKPEDGIMDIIRELENHEISAMPVVKNEFVLGMVSTDILARRSLLRLLQTQLD